MIETKDGLGVLPCEWFSSRKAIREFVGGGQFQWLWHIVLTVLQPDDECRSKDVEAARDIAYALGDDLGSLARQAVKTGPIEWRGGVFDDGAGMVRGLEALLRVMLPCDIYAETLEPLDALLDYYRAPRAEVA